MIWEGLLAVFAGSLVGLFLGATGGGGALLAVPLLVYVLTTPVQLAVEMSLILVGITAWIGVWTHKQNDTLKCKTALVFSSTGMVGAWIGAQGHRLVPEEFILFLFGLLMLLISARMLEARDRSTQEQSQIRCADEFPKLCVLKVTGLGLGIGFVTGFLA